MNPSLGKVDFTRELPNSERRLAKVIGKTLKFNPFMRYSAKRIVGCSLFDDIRQPSMEILPKGKVVVAAVDEEGSFCYDNYESSLTCP
mmetsp:Transcript_15830/g.24364  ORF Transcript_15830/g.24364 Transcript_15830/m.24364 type:complete len:88 (+) Transcript_15830:1055-1318(+)